MALHLSRQVPVEPGNPMSWPLWWRLCMLASLSFFVMMGQVLSASVSPMLQSLIEDLHVSSTKASQLASWATLAVGLGNMWAVPTVAHIGGRYTIIIGLTIFTTCFFWQGAAKTYDSLLAARVIGGLSGGVVESMGPMMVIELFPQEYIGRAMSIYTFALGAGTVFGPLIAGYMTEGLHSWRYPNHLFGAISALNLLGTVLMFPEPVINIRVPGDPPVLVTDRTSDQDREGKEAARDDQREFAPTRAAPSSSITSLWCRRSFFVSFSYNHTVPAYISLFFSPFRLLAAPAVVVTVLLFGVTIAATIAASILVSLTFSQPPMLWTSSLIGLFNISVLIGLLVGMLLGGLLADKTIAWHLRRNGYYKAEPMLVVILPMAVSTPLSIALLGVGLQRGWHWAIIGLLWTILNVNLTGGCTIMISYSAETYPEKAIHVGVVVNVIKNVVAASISFATVDWWFRDHYLMFLTLAMIMLLIFILVLPLWVWGPRIAQISKPWVKGYDVN